MITPEDRKRIEAIRRGVGNGSTSWVVGEVPWLLDLVERQEATLVECAIVLEALHAAGGTGIQPDIERAVLVARRTLGIEASS